MSTATFKAAVIRTPGGPDSIEFIDLPVAGPGPGEVRVQIVAAPVNPVDLTVASGPLHAMGLINQPDHTGLGWDFAGTVAAVGPGVDLAAASTVPLNALTAAQIVDLLGDAPTDGSRLLVTGAAGAVGGYTASLAQDRGWQVTGLARAEDEDFVRSLGAGFTTNAGPGWDAVADGAVMQEQALALVRDGGAFVGVQPSAKLPAERGIRVDAVIVHPDGPRLAGLLARTVSGELPARVHAVVPLDQVADAHRAVAKGGLRGRYVLTP